MAELSNDGSGIPAVTSSASTLPSASARLSTTGASGWMAASTSARWVSTGSMPLCTSACWLIWLAQSLQVVEVFAQPGHELASHVGPLARELDQGAQVVDLVAGVVAAAAEQHAVHAAAVGRVHPRQGLQRVGELDLAAAARRGLLQHPEYRRV